MSPPFIIYLVHVNTLVVIYLLFLVHMAVFLLEGVLDIQILDACKRRLRGAPVTFASGLGKSLRMHLPLRSRSLTTLSLVAAIVDSLYALLTLKLPKLEICGKIKLMR